MTTIRPKKCKSCGAKYQPRNGFQVACSIECGEAYAAEQRKKNEAKAKMAEAKAERTKQKEVKRRLDAMKSLPELLKECQQAFNKFIRLRDWGKPCISCQTPHTGQANSFDAGHYRSVGSAPHVRFDERNVHGQCKRCNRYGFDSVAYRDGLIAKIGLDQTQLLESDNKPKNYTKEELRDLVVAYRQKTKELSRDR